jgi:hypothetical protein
MITQQINVTDPEEIRGLYTNDEGAATVAGQVICLDDAAADVDGNKVNDANTGFLDHVIGIAREAVADGVQLYVTQYGYYGTAIAFQTDTSQPRGIKMIPVAGQHYMSSSAAADGLVNAPFVLLNSIASSSASATITAKVLVRCL